MLQLFEAYCKMSRDTSEMKEKIAAFNLKHDQRRFERNIMTYAETCQSERYTAQFIEALRCDRDDLRFEQVDGSNPGHPEYAEVISRLDELIEAAEWLLLSKQKHVLYRKTHRRPGE